MSPLKKPHNTAGEGSQAKLPSFSKVTTSSFSLIPMFLIYYLKFIELNSIYIHTYIHIYIYIYTYIYIFFFFFYTEAGKTYNLLLRTYLTWYTHYLLYSNTGKNVHSESTMPLAPSPSLQVAELWNKSNITPKNTNRHIQTMGCSTRQLPWTL